MLTTMRTYNKAIMIGTLILVIPSFIVLYGVGGGGGGGPRQGQEAWAFKVEGKAVPESSFYRARAQQINRLQDEFGPHWSVIVSHEELQRQLLNGMIDQQLALRFAEANGITVTPQEVKREITKLDIFKDDQGKFDENRYIAILRANSWPESYYLDLVRTNLTVEKVRQHIMSTVQVTPEEVWEEHVRRSSQCEAELLDFSSSKFAGEGDPNEDELRAFFEQHRNHYKLPDRVGIHYLQLQPREVADLVEVSDEEIEARFNEKRNEYALQAVARADFITFSPDRFAADLVISETEAQAFFDRNSDRYLTDLQGRLRYVVQPVDPAVLGITVTDDEIADHYANNQALYEQQEEVKLRHILINADEDAPDTVAAEALNKIQAVRASILSGTLSFADAALEYSDDPGSRENGGEYDFAPRGRYVKPFEEQAFSVPIGQISEPFRTQFGYHILEPLERREKRTRSLDEVREDIRKQLGEERARTAARQRLEQLKDRVGELTQAQVGDDFVVHETYTPVGRDVAALEGVAAEDVAYVVGSALGLRPGDISDVLVGQKHLYLVQLIEKIEPRPMNYVEAATRARDDLRRERALEKARSEANVAYSQLLGGASLEHVAATYGLPIQDSKLFAKQFDPNNSRRPTTSIAGVGPAARDAFMDAAFNGTIGSPAPPIADGDNGFHLLVVREKEAERLPELGEVRNRVRRQIAEEGATRKALEIAEDIIFHCEQHLVPLLQGAEKISSDFGLDLQPQTTSLFAKDEAIPEIGYRTEVINAAFSLRHPGQVYEAPIPVMGRSFSMTGQQSEQTVQAYYIIELATRSPEHLAELDEVRAQVIDHFKKWKGAPPAREAAQAAKAALTQALAAGSFPPDDATRTINLREFAKSIKADYLPPAQFSQSGYVANLGQAPAVARTGFALAVGQVSDVIEVTEEVKEDWTLTRGYYILQVTNRIEPKREDFTEEQRKQIYDQLLINRRNTVYRSWLDQLRVQAQVEINERLLQFDDEEADEETESATGEVEVSLSR